MNPEEKEILKRFINTGKIKGTYFIDIGAGGIEAEPFIADVVCVEGLEEELEPRILRSKWWHKLKNKIEGRYVWVFEVKKELNFEAIGQILVYSYYIPLRWNVLLKGKAIICDKTNKSLEEVCKKLSINVFEV